MCIRDRVDSDAECSRPTTPGSSGVWTPLVEKDEEDNQTIFHEDVGDFSASLPYDVPAPDYFSSSPIVSPSKSHNELKADPAVVGIPITPEPALQDADTSTPKALQIPRSRPLRSTASLALLRPDTASSTNSSSRPATRRLQSLPSSKAAASVVTHLDTLPAVTITHATASPARASTARTTTTPSNSAASWRPESNEAAKESFGGLRVGSWLQKWRGSKPKTETDATCKTSGAQPTNKNDRSVSAPVSQGPARKVSSTVAKLQAILDTDEARHEAPYDEASEAVPTQETAGLHTPQAPATSRTDPSMLRDLTLPAAKKMTPVLTSMRTPGVNQPGGLGLFLRSVSENSFFADEEEAMRRGRGVVEGVVDEEALRECFDEDDQQVGVAERAEDEAGEEGATPKRGRGGQQQHSAMTFFPRPRLDDDGVSTFAPPTPRAGRVLV